ncbi:MAG: 2-oxo-3-(phosphooxy)propyl 3-oxoalkanoate synthase [Actinomycetota bacterium]|nr:2-oxo-3-(phosphooxy)propyl 3-oxoalkanoate synthase [Actinomycetota bacterium]
MTEVNVKEQWRLDENVALTFDRTIDRCQVHRSAVSEVFITDVHALGGTRVALAAQLPTCHAYFNDHGSTVVDPLLIMEVCRQAGLATAYELGVSTDVVLITEDWDLWVAEPGAWNGAEPVTDLRIDSEFAWTRVRRGRPRAGICEQRVFAQGRQVATLNATSRFLNYEELAVLRTAQRGTPPPWSADLAARPDPELVQPHIVGRHDCRNVLLAGLRRGPGELSARVALPLANRALFDHSYDHVTMQVLIEAARQLSVVAVTAPDDAIHQWRLTRFAGRFTRFAELDSAVTVRTASPVLETDVREFHVIVEQEGEHVAEVELTLAHDEGRS